MFNLPACWHDACDASHRPVHPQQRREVAQEVQQLRLPLWLLQMLSLVGGTWLRARWLGQGCQLQHLQLAQVGRPSKVERSPR
jgi:hypothetical protein